VDWINPTGASKVHSLMDKVYKQKNLEMAWEMVKANRGSGGVDGQSLEGFAAQRNQQLDRLQSELKEDVYRPQPVRQVQIPKAGKPGEFRTLGIPTIYDRVCQQALLNRLEPIFEPVRSCRDGQALVLSALAERMRTSFSKRRRRGSTRLRRPATNC
jgi:retron-type reverse transcriptase